MCDNSCLDSSPKGRKHALVLPLSLQAHIAGIWRHSIELSKRGVTVTFVSLEKDIALLKTFKEGQRLGFNLISYQDSEDIDAFSFLTVGRNLFQPIFDKLVKDKNAGLPGPTCIIGDHFLTWVLHVAKELNIPYYQFWSSGAIYVRTLQAYPQLLADGGLTEEETGGRKKIAEFDALLEIPGLPALKYEEVPNSIVGVDLFKLMGNAIGKADAVIVNSFDELEIPIIDAIQQSWLNDSGGKIHQYLFLVGPLSTAATFEDLSFLEELHHQRHDCLKWLDGRPPQSVVYVCLGSLVQFDAEQINELAIALEDSEQSFLWVIRRGSEVEALPPGFEAQTREKGMIVHGWVPQLQILRHCSVGGFVTHCGWNSIVESIISGVPMAAWPQMRNDQFLNCRYLVDVLKIAAEVRPQDGSGRTTFLQEFGASSNPVKREELERAVRLLMSEEGTLMRLRVQELKRKAEAAVADGGTSVESLKDLVERIPGEITA